MTIIHKRNLIIDLLENPCEEIVDESRLDKAEKHINLIHRDYDGNMTLCIAQNNDDRYRSWNQYSFKSTDLEAIIYKFISEDNDVYISTNGFWNYTRRVEDLRHLKAFALDIDYYKMELYRESTPESMWKFIKNKEKYFFKKIGKPSLVISSGRGLYLIWLIKSAHPNALTIWELCMKELFNKFKPYGADVKSLDAAHVFRLCGSMNTKNNKIVNFIDLNKEIEIYDLEHFRNTLLPNNFEKYISKKERDKYKNEKAKQKKNSNRVGKKELKAMQVANLFNVYKLHHTRIEDLKTLIEIRNYDIHEYNCREKILFYYRYWSCCFSRNTEKALEDAISINSTFTKPLDEKEVIEATRSAEQYFKKWEETFDEFSEMERMNNKKFTQKEMNKFFYDKGCHIYTNLKIIDELEIKRSEMSQLKTIIDVKEKNFRSKDYRNEFNKTRMKEVRRKDTGMTKPEYDKYEKMLNISKMMEQGYKQVDISKKYGYAKGTVSKYLKELRLGEYNLEEKKQLFKDHKRLPEDKSSEIIELLEVLNMFELEEVAK